MTASPIDIYRRQIERELEAGNATEHTHRPALKTLVESLAHGVTATNEPKRVECGAPDFIITRKTAHGPVTLGYIEAKDVGKSLDEIERSEQLRRYRVALPNLILTDYLEFRWYVNGESRQSARLARVTKGGKLAPEKDGSQAVSDLLTGFLAHPPQEINDPKALALRMARLTHFIRDMIVTAFERKSASATLRDLHKAFEEALIPDLAIPQFADMFAQTLAYGLFAARCNHRGPRGSFKRLGAAAEIPKTNPFLRQLFETITGTALDEEAFVGFVDDLAQLLADTDIDAVLADFGKRTARQDPVVHFYETFLAAYDPRLREKRGVYYTPEPVVSYIVRSVDGLLKNRFGCAGGLADTATVEYEREQQVKGKTRKVKVTSPRVLILDPACGTGTFLYSVVDHIRAEFVKQGNAGMWSGYVRNHLLARIFGFELLMAPYAVAHFKLGMQLAGYDLDPAMREKWAYDFSGEERLGVFLTNTLEEAEIRAETLFGPLRVITQEANAASEIKSELPIMVIIGNPPYSGNSANRSWEIKKGKKVRNFIGNLLQDYYAVDGQPLGERNPKMLQDDYVKFLRFGQWRIERTQAGILAFITNHGYLDNPTFRGMRQQLMQAFSDIYILDLHGNAKKKEICPDGSKDTNVFDIQQGVAIGIFVKEPGKRGQAKVHHASLWGLRESKYRVLADTELSTTKWDKVQPGPPFYTFVPQIGKVGAEYEALWSYTDIFSVTANGFKTHRDDFAISFDRDTLKNRIAILRSRSEYSDEDLGQRFGLPDTETWKLGNARKLLQKMDDWEDPLTPCVYRPFDQRWIYYHDVIVERMRSESMWHFRFPNQGIIVGRQGQVVGLSDWDLVYCGRILADTNLFYRGGIEYVPLYLYPTGDDEKRGDPNLEVDKSRWPVGLSGRRPNLNPEFIGAIENRIALRFVPDGKGNLTKTFGPEDIFNYIYATFHSPTYRKRYAEFLKIDFPRVPLTSDLELFRSLCGLGRELVALHLLESPKLEKPIARFPVKGPNLVDKGFPKYVAPGEPEPGTGKPVKEGRVYINKGDATVAAVSDRRDEYGVRELAPALESGGKPPHSKIAAPRAALQRAKTGDEEIVATTGQYFEGVPPEVWNFHIGGYQVCEKWLKDRRGRTLTYDDLEHYCKVVTAIHETIRLMAEIDATIPKWPID